MKTLFTAMLLIYHCSGTFAQHLYKSAIVGFYNFENLYDTIFHGSNDDISFTPSGTKAYTGKVFHEKIYCLARVLSELAVDINPDGPAILGVAEIENKFVLDALLRHPLIVRRNYKYVHYDSKDFRGVDVALIYNPKYFKVQKSRPVFVKIPAGTKDAVYTRDILWVRGLLDGENVHIFVNHWPSRSGGEKRSEPARMAAAQAVRNFIDSLNIIDPGAKIIVMGDFNDGPADHSITKGLKTSGDITSITAEVLYNPWASLHKNGTGTLAYQDAWSLFDQIIFSGAFLDKKQPGFFYYKNQVFKRDYMIEHIGPYKGYPMRTFNGDVYRGGYSDHFPTYIVLLKRAE